MKKNLKTYVIVFAFAVGFFGCEKDSIEENAIEQNQLSIEMEAFQKQLTVFDSAFTSKTTTYKTTKENSFIEAAKNLLLANGISENKVNELMMKDKDNLVKMAMLTFFENKKLIIQ